MGRSGRRKSFADIMQEEKSRIATERAHDGSQRKLVDGVLVGPDGRTYVRTTHDLRATDALAQAAAGAAIGWDPCGCGGHCGLRWYDKQQVAAMISSGPPIIRRKKNRRGAVSEWRAEDGAVLLLAENAVRWGPKLG